MAVKTVEKNDFHDKKTMSANDVSVKTIFIASGETDDLQMF